MNIQFLIEHSNVANGQEWDKAYLILLHAVDAYQKSKYRHLNSGYKTTGKEIFSIMTIGGGIHMAFKFSGVDHVQLAAPEGCEAEARKFFVDLLGWEEIPKPELLRKRGGVWFQCGTHQVHVGVQKDFVPAKKAHPAFHVENISELREYLLQKNVNVIDDDARADEGVKRFYLNDPFGNRLEFLEWV